MDFELCAPNRVRVRGPLNEAMVSAMKSDGPVIKNIREAEFSLDDYVDVVRASADGARYIPLPVLKTVLSKTKDEAEWNELLTPKRAEKTWTKKVAPFLSPKLQAEMKPHQRVAIVKALCAKRFLLGDAPGCGKTPVGIACAMWVLAENPNARVLVVCPPKLREQWADEICTWTEGKIKTSVRRTAEDDAEAKATRKALVAEGEGGEEDEEQEEGEGEEEQSGEARITVVGYSVASNPSCAPLFAELFAEKWDLIVADESHEALGSDTSKTTNNLVLDAFAPFSVAEYVLLMTGSLSGPKKVYSQLQVLYPQSMSVMDFEVEYCGGRDNSATGQWEADGVTHADELNVFLGRRMVRRTKEEVLSGELPTQTVEVVHIELAKPLLNKYRALEIQRKNAQARMDSVRDARSANFARNQVKLLTNEMYRALTEAKMPACKQWIREESEKLWNERRQKMVVFTHHDKARQDLCKSFPQHAVAISGTTPEKVRLRRIKALRSETDDSVRLGFLSNRACGAGINLTPAVTTIVILEQDYSEAVDAQVKDRIYRIGAKHACRVVYLLAKDTMDESIFKKVDEKYAATSSVVEGESRKRKVHSHTTMDYSSVGTVSPILKEWGVQNINELACPPNEGENFLEFLERCSVAGSLSDAHQAGLVDPTKAAVALAAGEPIPGSRWFQVEIMPAAGGPMPATTKWMDEVEVRVLTKDAEEEIARTCGEFSGLERFKRVLQRDSGVAAFVSR